MANAKEEFLKFINDKPKVKCAEITHGRSWYDTDSMRHFHLKVNHTELDWYNFIESLSFNYDDGYGGQELYATIWFEDGTWADRAEYDGSEWYEYHTCPVIPMELLP